jgi:hypothetical protein
MWSGIGGSTVVDASCKTTVVEKFYFFGTDEYPSMYSKLNTRPLLPSYYGSLVSKIARVSLVTTATFTQLLRLVSF